MKSDKISSKELFNAIDEIYEEKGITREYLIESLKMALEAAYKKNYETTEDIIVDVNEQNIKVYAVKTVVEKVEDKNKEISLDDESIEYLIYRMKKDSKNIIYRNNKKQNIEDKPTLSKILA